MNIFFFYLFYIILFLSNLQVIQSKKDNFICSSKLIINSIKINKDELLFNKIVLQNYQYSIEYNSYEEVIVNITSQNKQVKNETFSLLINFCNETSLYHIINNIKIKIAFIHINDIFYKICHIYKDININIDYQNNILNNNSILFLNISNNIYKYKKSFIIYSYNPIIIKYFQFSPVKIKNTLPYLPEKEKNLNTMNYSSLYTKRKLSENIIYYSNNIFNNTKALENKDTIEKFFKIGINIFDLNETFFTDICYQYSENKKDIVLEDRILFFFQNYSLCVNGCILYNINLTSYEFTCECSKSFNLEETKKTSTSDDEEPNEEFTSETIAQEFSNIFFETNLEVLTCLKKLLTKGHFSLNIGTVITLILIIIQIISSIFLFKGTKELRKYIFKNIIKYNGNPPLKKRSKTTVRKNSNNRLIIRQRFINDIESKKDINNININPVEQHIQTIDINNNKIYNDNINNGKINNNISLKKTTNQPLKYINYLSNQNTNINDNYINFNANPTSTQRKIKEENLTNDLLISKRKQLIKKKSKRRSMNFIIPEMQKEKNIEENNINFKKEINTNKNDNNMINNNNIINNQNNLNIFKYKKNKQNEIITTDEPFNSSNNLNNEEDIQENETIQSNNNSTSHESSVEESEIDEPKKNNVEIIEKKELDDFDLDELNFDEATIYDKRGFYKLFCYILKQRQIFINTFCYKEKLKPFPIKLIVITYNISCYFVISGFLFNEEHIKKIFRRKKKGFYFFITNSIEQIFYTSIVGAVINIIINCMFKSDKNLRNVQNKYKDDIIMRNGEIVKIYKYIKKTHLSFVIFNFLTMIFFVIYIFCFCGVFPNSQLEWVESSYLIIMITNIFSIFICLLLTVLRKIGLKYGAEFLYKFSNWIAENI